MARSCVVRRQANFFCWNFLSELSTPHHHLSAAPLLLSRCPLSLKTQQRLSLSFFFFSSRIIPGPASQGIIIIVEYFLEDMSSTPLSTSPLPSSAAPFGHDEGARFLRLFRVTRPWSGGFVRAQHLALSSEGDQTAALGCERMGEEKMRGSNPTASQDVGHVWSFIIAMELRLRR